MENQEQDQSIPQTEGQLTEDVKVTEIFPFLPARWPSLAPEVLTNPQEAHRVVLEEMQRRRVQPPSPHDGSRLSWAGNLRTVAPEGQEFPYDAFYHNGRMHFRADTPATDAKAEVVDDEPATEATAEAEPVD